MSKHQDFRDFVLNHEFDQFAKIEDGRAAFHLWQDEYEALQSAMATNAGGLSTIAQSKLEQMGATVHGVLVKNEAGAWAAVSDAGRVMWLDGFEGRADETRATVTPSEHGKNRYGLDMAYFRELFNRELNRPLTDFRPDELARVLARAARTADAAVLQEPEFQVASTQSGQGVEPVAWGSKPSKPGRYVVRGFDSAGTEALVCVAENDGELVCNLHDSNSDPLESYSNLMSEISDRFEWVELHTHPRPAQQGSVPESRLVDLAKALARDVIHLEDCEDREDRWTVEDRARSIAADIQELLSTHATPQPEGGGWIKCSERLPKLGQRVQLFSQGVIQHMMPLFDDSDEGLFWDFEVHDYNPPVDMSRDQWRPLPQPPKEGSGDERA